METMDDKLLKRYLLGELPTDEQRRLEEQCFSDAQSFERLNAIEDDLIDDYICSDLSHEQRTRFESHFLVSPERRARLATARALIATIAAQPKPAVAHAPASPWWESLRSLLTLQSPAVRFAMVTASLALLVFYGTNETLKNRTLRQQLSLLKGEQESLRQAQVQDKVQVQAQREQLQSEFEAFRQQSAHREQQLISQLEPAPHVLQSTSRTRSRMPDGQRLQEMEVTRDSYWVKLQLEFDKETAFKSYRAALQPSTGGGEIWSQSRLQAQLTGNANAVVVMLPAAIFRQADESSQEYKLTLWGTDPAGEHWIVRTYAFRVAAK